MIRFAPYEKGYGLRNYPFRIWDKKNKCMSFSHRNYFFYKSNPSRYVVMNCTRSLDTNSVLIYEYDFLHFFDGSSPDDLFGIDMHGVALKPCWSDSYKMVRADGCSYGFRDDMTYVIGNAMENESNTAWGRIDTSVSGLQALANRVHNPFEFRWVMPVLREDCK